MNKRFQFAFWSCVLIFFGLLLTSTWAYWNEQPTGDAWVVQEPEQRVSGATVGQKLRVAFILRNRASQPRRILGARAC